MEQCIDQCLSPDQVDLLLDLGLQLLWVSSYADLAAYSAGRELLEKTGQLALNTRRCELRCAETAEDRAAFFKNPTYYAQSIAKGMMLGRMRRHCFDDIV
jgi:hypothetical protein